jgi:hypothetical protein
MMPRIAAFLFILYNIRVLWFIVISLTCAKTAGKAVCRCSAFSRFAYVRGVTDFSHIKIIKQLRTSYACRICPLIFIWL